MGKASSSKKVARAARTGGRVAGQRRNIGFPAAIAVIVIVGIGLIAFVRPRDAVGSPTVDNHWHAAFGIYICDRWLANVADGETDPLGIHTHADGLVHIHPFVASGAGKSATLGRFFDQVGLRVSNSSITLPSTGDMKKRNFVEGETTCNGKPGKVKLAYWPDAVKAATTKPKLVKTEKISKTHFSKDRGAYTLAFVPEGTTLAPPPASAQIETLGAADVDPTDPGTSNPQISLPPTVGASIPGDPESTEPVTPLPSTSAPATTAGG